MKRLFLLLAVVVGLAMFAYAQQPSIYFGVGVGTPGPVLYRPWYPAYHAYGPAYPVVYGPYCGPACQQARWRRQQREREWRERERRERWRRDMCRHGHRQYCGW